VPSGAALHVWETLLEAGKSEGIEPMGLEALLLMRLEKGFLHIGTDTDGATVPEDVGWGRVAANKSADFIGKRSLTLPENLRPDRLQLVGLTSDSDIVIGSHLRFPGSTEATDGWVTSAGQAPLTGAAVALALLRGGRAKIGTEIRVHDMGCVTRAEVVEPPFYDRPGDRMSA
jgi:sarcosine oxidase, subunit alpha